MFKLEIPEDELTFTFARSSGSGGQNVNKVNSKAILHWNIEENTSIPFEVKSRFIARYQNRISKDGFVVIASEEHRDQNKNVELCIQKLNAMLESVRVPPKKRRATKPTRGSKERRLQSKRVRSERKENRKKESW